MSRACLSRFRGLFRRGARLAGVALLLAAAGCTYRGGIEEPLVQKTSWFSYLNGDDIRAACAAGAPPHYRLVYNGRYEEQVRAYELIGDGAGGAVLIARVQERPSLLRVTSDDLLAPWRWRSSSTPLSPPEVAGFESSLGQSGFFEAAPRGLRLDSRRFYWIVVGCRDGEVHFNAWQHPDAGFAALAFPGWLARFDETGVPVNPPRRVDPAERLAEVPRKGEGGTVNFDLTVAGNGLAGLLRPF